LNGEPLEPVLPATAEAQRNGIIGAGQVAVIRGFFHRLPDFVDIETRAKAEAQLARGADHRPDALSKLADKLTDCLNPDGDFTDIDRTKRRGITIVKQEIDGMSPINGFLNPEARATIDAVFAKLAGPGMCNPSDGTPCVGGIPSQTAVDNDTRTAGQRNHDALLTLARAALSSGELGQHNGLPGQRCGHHDAQRAGGRRRQGRYRWGHPAADVRCDPAGVACPSLPGHLRQRQSAGALSHQATRLTSPANRPARQGLLR